ncbi:hypothetical protein SH467x_000537 [Pirellulaceae bacterium SH467]
MKRLRSLSIAACLVAFFAPIARSGDEFEHAPISYYDSESKDPVALLWKEMESGNRKLEPDENGEYLRPLLDALRVPVESQCLVFSKTSLQINHISPRTPRAIYFNDSVYVGYVQGSSIIELTAIDPQLGCVFYTFEAPTSDGESEKDGRQEDNSDDEYPTIIRDRGQCLSCHATTRTERVPGVLVRSIYPDKAGRPRSGASSFVTDHRSPFIQRWGGWYVTGKHGEMRHLGNLFALDRQNPELVNPDAGANWSTLAKTIDTEPYLRSTSDIVALMVMEHQTRVHNLITRANYETRMALHLDAAMNQALNRPSDHRSDSTKRRIASAGDELVKGLLFAEEFPLETAVGEDSAFRERFTKRGPFDSQGRSLYQLNCQTRLFQHRCSYLILSEQFDALPSPVMEHVREKVSAILRGKCEPPEGMIWDEASRKATLAVVEAVKPGWLGAE